MKFELGELVVSATGGPAMVVTNLDPLRCTWVSRGRYTERGFPAEALVSLVESMNRAIDAAATRRQAALSAQRLELDRERAARRVSNRKPS